MWLCWNNKKINLDPREEEPEKSHSSHISAFPEICNIHYIYVCILNNELCRIWNKCFFKFQGVSLTYFLEKHFKIKAIWGTSWNLCCVLYKVCPKSIWPCTLSQELFWGMKLPSKSAHVLPKSYIVAIILIFSNEFSFRGFSNLHKYDWLNCRNSLQVVLMT